MSQKPDYNGAKLQFMKNAKIYLNITVCLSNCDEISATPSAFCISETRLQRCKKSQKPDYNGARLQRPKFTSILQCVWAIVMKWMQHLPRSAFLKPDYNGARILRNQTTTVQEFSFFCSISSHLLLVKNPTDLFRQMSLHLGRLPTTRLISGRKS